MILIDKNELKRNINERYKKFLNMAESNNGERNFSKLMAEALTIPMEEIENATTVMSLTIEASNDFKEELLASLRGDEHEEIGV